MPRLNLLAMDSDTAMCHMALTLDHIELIIREALMRLSGPYSEPLALISERKGYIPMAHDVPGGEMNPDQYYRVMQHLPYRCDRVV